MRYTKTLTGTKKTKPLDAPNIDRHQKNQKKQKFQQLLRSGPIVPGNFSFFGFFWCLCRFGASSGLFFLFFLVFVQVWWLWLHKTLTGTKKTNKPLDAPNIGRHQTNQKKQTFQQLLRSGPIVPGIVVFFVFFWCLSMFGASSGLFFLFFFGACAGLVTLTSQNIDRHQKKPKKPNH